MCAYSVCNLSECLAGKEGLHLSDVVEIVQDQFFLATGLTTWELERVGDVVVHKGQRIAVGRREFIKITGVQ